MSRWCASLLVLLLAGGPLAQLRCAASCTSAAPGAADECHDRAAAPVVAARLGAMPHDCGTHVAPPFVTDSSGTATPLPRAVASSVFAAPARTAAPPVQAVPAIRSGGPPGHFPIPQRI